MAYRSNLDVAERRCPRTGALPFRFSDRQWTAGLHHPFSDGEGAVLRILDKSAMKLDSSTWDSSPRS